MARQARLFDACNGSPAKATHTAVANVPPMWIERAHEFRKKLEPAVVKAMRKINRLRLQRPGAKVTIKAADKDLRQTLKTWELAYQKENFYNGLRVLMELQRNGVSDR